MNSQKSHSARSLRRLRPSLALDLLAAKGEPAWAAAHRCTSKWRQGKLLQITFFRLGREVLFERGFDVPDACLLALDEIRVVAMHPTGQLSDLDVQRLAQLGRKTGRPFYNRARQGLQSPQLLGRNDGLNSRFCGHFLPIFLPIYAKGYAQRYAHRQRVKEQSTPPQAHFLPIFLQVT